MSWKVTAIDPGQPNEHGRGRRRRRMSWKVTAIDPGQPNEHGFSAGGTIVMEHLVKKFFDGEIKTAVAQGLTSVDLKVDLHDDHGRILTLACVDRLQALGYVARAEKKHVPEYKQDGHFDEGDYSHEAYDEFIIHCSWGTHDRQT